LIKRLQREAAGFVTCPAVLWCGDAFYCSTVEQDGAAVTGNLTRAAALRRARELMVQYADCPMDFADSTLVVVAEDLKTNTVLTTDRRDFSVYRIDGRKRFEIPI